MPESSPHSEHALELLAISCTFRSRDADAVQRYTAVSNTTLRINAGEFVSVVGPTGCGKSTLLNIGAGLLEPSSGGVKVFGEPLRGINTRARRHRLGSSAWGWASLVTATRISFLAACASARRWHRSWCWTLTSF